MTRRRAETLAAAAGRSLGKVTTVVEGGGTAPEPMFAKAAASDSSTPIEAGTQETTARSASHSHSARRHSRLPADLPATGKRTGKRRSVGDPR